MGGDVVGNHPAGVGPADQPRAFEARRVHHGLHLVAPCLGIPVARGIERLVGIAVAAQIVGHDAKFPGESAVDLAHPRQVALRETVDEQDFRTRRVAPLLRRNRQAVRRLHADRLVLQWLRNATLRDRDEKCSDRQLGEATARQGYRHGQSTFTLGYCSMFNLASLMSLPHFSCSATMKAPNCSGVLPATSIDCSASFATRAGSLIAFSTSAFSRAMTGAGVPAGTTSPTQAPDWSCG